MLMVIVLLTSGSIAAYGAFVDEIVFVDDALEDYKMLMDSIPEGVRVVVLDGKKDGIEQMAEYLKNKNDLDAIHIISHGGAGEISVGTAVLNSQTMGSYLEKLDIIGQSLKENGDLLLYGCDVASGGLGKQFVENVARITDADVAASEDETGSAAQGGNWILEFQSGIIDTRTGLFSNMDTYPFLLEVKEDLIHTYSQNTWAFNKLAVDPDGTIYLTHKVSGTEIAVKEWNGTSWSPLPSITTANTGDTGFSDDLDLAVDSNNKLHIAFRHNIGSGVTSLRGVKYGLYNGSSWTFAEIEAYSDPSGGKNFDDPSIAVDSEGFAHMVYLYSDSTGYYLKYATNRSGSWVTSTVVVGASGGIDEIHNPGIVIDGNNIVHVSYVKEDNQNDFFGNYYYTKKTIGETNFLPAQKLIDAVAQGKNYYYTPIVSDSSNSLYFAYYEESYDESYAFQNTTSYLNTNKSGSWQSTQVNYDNVRMTSPIGVYVVNSKKYLLMHSFSADWSENYFFAMADYGSGWFKGTKTIIPALVEVGGYEDEREFVVDSSGNFMLVMLHGELKKISSLTGTSDDFGLGTLAPEDVEITGFDAISNVSAGTAGSATYASVAEVQAALLENVTANAGAVTVPVTAWVDTDGYNPAVAGSYTFTAILGSIPSGYANPNDYTATVEVVITGTVASNDATLKISSTIKGQTVTSLGTPSSTLGSVTGGTVTITAAKAADTSNTGSFITLFEKNNTNATVKVVKYASGASTAGFASDTAYANQAISNGDFFIIKVTAEDTLIVNYYKVKVKVTSASSGSSGGSGSSATTTQPSQVTSQNTVVVVNGKEQNAGKETQKTEDGKSTVTVAIDNKAIDNKIDEAIKTNTTGLGNVIQVPVADTKSEVAKVELTGDIVKKLEENTFDVSVKRDNVEYIIPAAEFTISKVAANLGIQEKALADIKVEVKITKLDEKVVEKYNEVAKTNGAELVFSPVQFEITAKTTNIDGTTKEHSINKFSNYVERVMEIPSGVDPSKITTGIVFNVDGTYSHVPTEVYQKGGKWYAKLNSLTNSDYSVIWNPITVRSVENHWSKDAVNDMASRLVIFNSETFEPDKAITRADFAEYIVRGLGLYREGSTHKNNFKDVTATGERTLAILIANEYGVVSGYADGTFRGDNQITREEAMAMYKRAMKITKLVGSDENRYQNYTDYSQVSEWAATYVKEVLSSHVFNGTTETKISPKASLTYAEAAQAIRNLLVESNLINK
ncbi:MAG: DUF4347 domain-containing protein [[Clostridium] symbiosum]|nr:DUF4347 domain-containing protein [[Clostridium] symbiosum]